MKREIKLSVYQNCSRFGRKPTLIFCVVGGAIGNLKTFATKYYIYAIIEFLEAAVTGGSYAAAMVICEYITLATVFFIIYLFV